MRFPVFDDYGYRVSVIVWAIGYELDFAYPIQRRGVTEEPGLAFVGLHWMHTRKSGLIWGVGEDAGHIVSSLLATAG